MLKREFGRRQNGLHRKQMGSNNKYHLLKGDVLQTLNAFNAKLHSICHLLALLGAHHIFHISRIRVNHKCEKRIIRPLSLFISICCSASSINAGR
jgi:hypothetical protein